MENSKIQWTNHTWNPWHGCIKVSPGCKFCYMYRDKDRYGQDPTVVLRSKTKFNDPLYWQGVIEREGFSYRIGKVFPGMKIFTCSWSDFFIEQADPWREEAWDIIRQTPEFIYQILTKRPERIHKCLPKDWGKGYPNVWLGVSVESQEQTWRVEELGQLKYNDSIFKTFISAEPLIDFVDFTDGVVLSYQFERFDWMIIGGESGNETGKWKYRPCERGWILDIIHQCKEYDIPVFVKQLGSHLAKEMQLQDKFGGDINEFPGELQLREFPQTVLATK